MSSQLCISIPERLWIAASLAPRDGSLLFVRDNEGQVDLAMFRNGRWHFELDILSEIVEFAPVAIATPPDHDGRCGRCGRVRSGP